MGNQVRKFKETVDLQANPLTRLKKYKYFPATVLVVVFLAVACFHIWQRVYVMSLVREVAQLRDENRQLIDISRKTHTDIASLSMNSRIEAYAKDSLGLSLVPADRQLTLKRLHAAPKKPDRLDMILTSLENVSKHLPMLSGNPVNADELKPIKFDSTKAGGKH